MTALLFSLDRYRAVGCFQPEELEALERVYDATMAEIRRRPEFAAQAEGDDLRARVAASIIRSAKRGTFDAARIEAEALAAVAKPPDAGACAG
jgi:hypothetical protein